MQTAKTILRRLFRVYAHIYHSHFDQICALGIEGELDRMRALCAEWQNHQMTVIAHLNTNYRHFLLFVDEVSSPASLWIWNCISWRETVQATQRERSSTTGRLQQHHPARDRQVGGLCERWFQFSTDSIAGSFPVSCLWTRSYSSSVILKKRLLGSFVFYAIYFFAILLLV